MTDVGPKIVREKASCLVGDVFAHPDNQNIQCCDLVITGSRSCVEKAVKAIIPEQPFFDWPNALQVVVETPVTEQEVGQYHTSVRYTMNMGGLSDRAQTVYMGSLRRAVDAAISRLTPKGHELADIQRESPQNQAGSGRA